jgi:hypothetical protein
MVAKKEKTEVENSTGSEVVTLNTKVARPVALSAEAMSKLSLKKVLTRPLLKHPAGSGVRIMFKAPFLKQPDRTDGDGVVQVGPYVALVVDRASGILCHYIVNAVARGALEQEYPCDGYVDKWFAIMKEYPANGKRWSNIIIGEENAPEECE